jgi:hypothetical protein
MDHCRGDGLRYDGSHVLVGLELRVHKSLRFTPAMEAGISDHVWSVRELLEAA